MDLLPWHILLVKGVRSPISWSKMLIGNGSDHLAIHLFWPGSIYISAPETCFYMRHRNTTVVRSKSSRHRCCSVALNYNPTRANLIEDLADGNQQSRAQLIESLVGRHYIKVNVRDDVDQLKDLVEQVAMLSSSAHSDSSVLFNFQAVYNWK